MARITPLQNKIFEAHIEAFINEKFDFTPPQGCASQEEVHQSLRDGKTFKELWDYLSSKNIGVFSQIYGNWIKDVEQFKKSNYYKQVRANFRDFLTRIGIV